ncbi:tRNA (N6-threonylcarbamoyladenosine(37)-N6)-methyltransferase TrmO [uncultured Hydrogenophaga sp.]|uniref:tRNA (N6-threonylcarbamoyladenosine(37)-N6)-methyltransferase TrmO n=1 Tax=uncultured Hydrogenophaga sp. TaxID=199683 RepID=UPI002586A2D2|nr:tRNA (N6-threonylcarbamoyladenosine(37)-N6)-methyltransferase TrmO [uncultured Hydrogenophaga sp.]
MNPAKDEALVVRYQPIGRVRSAYATPEGVPLQTAASPDQPVRVEIDAAYLDGLKDVEGFDHLWLFTHLHLARTEPLEVTPFLDTRTHGVFATRSPARPNRIGLSLVRLVRVDGATLHCLGNDLVDGTPVLDIKPYVPRFDVREAGRIGWFADRLQHLEAARADRRMTVDTGPDAGPHRAG